MTSANMTLAELSDRIGRGMPFYSSATDMDGQVIAVLSTYPVGSRRPDGTLKNYAPGDPLSLLVKPGTKLNDRVNTDANRRTHNYLTALPGQSGRQAEPDMVVYYVVRKSTGHVLAVVYADRTFELAPRPEWRSDRGYRAVSDALQDLHWNTAAIERAASGY